jgi:hypothetical protein
MAEQGETDIAGQFKTLNDERSDVMQAIERYARKQKEFSDPLHDSPAARASVSASSRSGQNTN